MLADRRLDIRVSNARGHPELELWSKGVGLPAGQPVLHLNVMRLKLPQNITSPSQLGLNEDNMLFRDDDKDAADQREVCIGTIRLLPVSALTLPSPP